MSGESGGELDAAMLGVSMLDGVPGIFALGVESGSTQTSDGLALLEFVTSTDSSGNSYCDLGAILMFIAGADANGISTADAISLLLFDATAIDTAGAGTVSLSAWLQMLHAQGDLSEASVVVIGEDRAMKIYDDARIILVPMDRGADGIVNNNEVVTI